ncbi:MAG: hypothetical protein DRQ52_02850, partial [Gammaproteobacteria bacterium]
MYRVFSLHPNIKRSYKFARTLSVKTLSLSILLLNSLLLTTQPNAATDTTVPDWCTNYRIPLTEDANSGRVVLHASLIAKIRLGVPVNPVQVTLVGRSKKLPTITSKLQCSNLVIFNQVPPGEYRVQSLQGNVNILGTPGRFLYPMTNDYQVLFRGGSTAIYRVIVPRDLEPTVTVNAGETSYAGKLSTDTQPANSPFGFIVSWDHQP